MKRILVTGAGGSAGNNFIASLRLAPEPFYIVGTDTSKYYIKLSKADKNYKVANWHDKVYINQLKAIIKEENIEFIHSQPDPEVMFISENRHLLDVKTLLPRPITIEIAHDKFWFNQEMEANKVPCPKSWLVIGKERLKIICQEHRGKKWLRAIFGAGSLAALPITKYEQAYMWIEYWKTKGLKWTDFMLSSFLPGKEYAFQSIWKDGKLITSAARERIEYLFQSRMPSGQSSTPTVAKSVHNKQVNQIATKGILALDYNPNGIYCVDLKENYNGVPCITEINVGRFFTTSLFFTKAGCNMPYYYVKLAYGEEIPKLKQYNAVLENLYWIRQIDCGEKMVKENEL